MHSLSATAELLINSEFHMAIRRYFPFRLYLTSLTKVNREISVRNITVRI